MKRFGAFLLLLAAITISDKVQAQTDDQQAPQWSSIVMVDDLLGIAATNPGSNPMRQLRILNSAGAIVYQDGNTAPDGESVNLVAAPAGTYTVQVKLQVGWEQHSFQLQ